MIRTEDRSQDTGTCQNPASMGRGAPAIDLGAEAEAWVEDQWSALQAAGTPASRAYLRKQLVRRWEREANTPWLTYQRKGGEVSRSVPVDAAVGELVARTIRV